MKKYFLSILLACLTFSMQAEEMWHVVGTNDYARKQCLSQISIVTDSLTGAAYYFKNFPFQAGEADLPEIYNHVFDRLVQTGSIMPDGNGDIKNIDEGYSCFYRGTWYLNELSADGGWWVWQDPDIPELQQCNWDADNILSKNIYIRLLYNLTLQNTYLHVADSLNLNPVEQLQVRFVRALTAWYLLDLFPESHFTTIPRIDGNNLMSRQQLYNWLENELLALTTSLPQTRSDLYHVDADAAKMLIARLYLNAEVYTGTPQWTKASQYAQQVMSGQHTLHTATTGAYSPYQELFMGDNDANGAAEEVLLMLKQDGNIAYCWGGSTFAIEITRNSGMPSWGLIFPWSCWRAGYRLLQAFATDDQLLTLKGTEFSMPALLGDDRAMFYADESYPVPSLSNTYDGDFTKTWSVNKFTARYSTDPMDGSVCSNSSTQWADTDIPLMRSAEAYLTYAEAQFRLGNTTEARNTIATLRSRAHATTPNTITLDYILDEWLREFYSEGRRRVDLVRFHQFAGPTATRTWEGHSSAIDADFNTFYTPDLLNNFPRLDNKVRYFARLIPKKLHEFDPDLGQQCDSCNTGETFYDSENNIYYTVNYGDYWASLGAFRNLYPVEVANPLELEQTEFPYTQQNRLSDNLPAVTAQDGAFVIMLHSDVDYGNNLVVLGDYLNAAGEWIYSNSKSQPLNHTTSGTTIYNQNFARFESTGDGWYKAVIYPIKEKDSNAQAPDPGYAHISGIAFYCSPNDPITITDVHKASGVVNGYYENSNGEMNFYFSQMAYYEDEIYGRVYYTERNTDRVVYLSVEGWEIPELPDLPAVTGTDGAVTLVVKFDEAPAEGYDILFVGDYTSSYWDFATSQAMTAIGDGWYKIVLYPNKDGTITGRPIQGANDDYDWSYDWSHNSSDIIAVQGVVNYMFELSGFGETNLRFYSSDAERAAVVYIECKKWNKTPSSNVPKVPYTITVQLPDFCVPFDVEIIGSFGEWNDYQTVLLQHVSGNTYQVVVNAKENDEWRIRGVGSWDYELQSYNAEMNSWTYTNNFLFGSDQNIVINLSNPNQYRWNVCEE